MITRIICLNRGAIVLRKSPRFDLNLTNRRWKHDLETSAKALPPEVTSSLPANIKWDTDAVVTKLAAKTEITGAIMPWSDLNFVQKLVFPYTYSIMYYVDYLLTIMPWWTAIIATNFAIRLVFLPVTIKHTKISVRAHNLMPETQKIQAKINAAMSAGNNYETAVQRTKLKQFFEDNDIKISDRFKPILIQAPAFFSMFFLMRKLSEIQVPSLTTGGALWFTDLTVADPYYILPVMTCLSNFLLFEYGMPSKPEAMSPVMRWGLRGLSVGLFPIVYSFPTSVVIFWTVNNLLTLSTNLILKLPKVRNRLGIPAHIVHDKGVLPLSNMSFKGQIKEAVDKSRASRSSQDIRRLDDIAFRKAGIGPLKKTYKEPPKPSET